MNLVVPSNSGGGSEVASKGVGRCSFTVLYKQTLHQNQGNNSPNDQFHYKYETKKKKAVRTYKNVLQRNPQGTKLAAVKAAITYKEILKHSSPTQFRAVPPTPFSPNCLLA